MLMSGFPTWEGRAALFDRVNTERQHSDASLSRATGSQPPSRGHLSLPAQVAFWRDGGHGGPANDKARQQYENLASLLASFDRQSLLPAPLGWQRSQQACIPVQWLPPPLPASSFPPFAGITQSQHLLPESPTCDR